MASIATTAALIVAAGSGQRFSSGVPSLPKQYLPVLGKTVLRRSIDAFLQAGIENITVVIHPDHLPFYTHAVDGLTINPPVMGGASRQESVRRGLEALSQGIAPERVLIHDSARCAVTPDLISRASQADGIAVIPVLPIVDTLRRIDDAQSKTERRENLFAVQTPQAFDFKTILDLHRQHASSDTFTDDAALIETAGKQITPIAGERGNIKLTLPQDLVEIESIITARCDDIRTGTGYDVHKFIAKTHDLQRLKIGGVTISHTHILEGHSDADVALHALTDALLATLCDGDIGEHFSPKDARWKNADSALFLSHAAGLILAKGGIISHADITIICEAPKIGPHRGAIRARIAEILRLPVSRISVKATTTEGLGFTGRGEGIAAQAIATVRLPFSAFQAAENNINDITVKAS